jgi:hypothetical protein
MHLNCDSCVVLSDEQASTFGRRLVRDAFGDGDAALS